MWYDLQLHLGEGTGEQSPDTARQWLAGLMNNAPEKDRPDLRLFHIKNNTQYLDGVSPFRFGAGKEMIRLYAVGESSCDLLAAEGHKLTRLLSRELQKPIKEIRQSGESSIQGLPYFLNYNIRNLVLRDFNWGDIKSINLRDKDCWKESFLLESLTKTIEKGLREQANLIARDGDDSTFEAPEDILIEILDVGSFRPFEVKPNTKSHRLAATKVVFKMNVKLEGIWHVGRLTARGCGLIRANGGY